MLDYDAIFIPGGLGPMVDITGNPEVQATVTRQHAQGNDRGVGVRFDFRDPAAVAEQRCSGDAV